MFLTLLDPGEGVVDDGGLHTMRENEVVHSTQPQVHRLLVGPSHQDVAIVKITVLKLQSLKVKRSGFSVLSSPPTQHYSCQTASPALAGMAVSHNNHTTMFQVGSYNTCEQGMYSPLTNEPSHRLIVAIISGGTEANAFNTQSSRL